MDVAKTNNREVIILRFIESIIEIREWDGFPDAPGPVIPKLTVVIF